MYGTRGYCTLDVPFDFSCCAMTHLQTAPGKDWHSQWPKPPGSLRVHCTKIVGYTVAFLVGLSEFQSLQTVSVLQVYNCLFDMSPGHLFSSLDASVLPHNELICVRNRSGRNATHAIDGQRL